VTGFVLSGGSENRSLAGTEEMTLCQESDAGSKIVLDEL
jgi:hypothetical protein